jgi:Relaxase/Mobilisation nuclease domain
VSRSLIIPFKTLLPASSRIKHLSNEFKTQQLLSQAYNPIIHLGEWDLHGKVEQNLRVMVAKITVPTSIKRALNYNEQKLKEGRAECIYAHNFLKKAESLAFHEKLRQFEKLIALNRRATTNTVHISLNFGLNEKIEREKLVEIAKTYMNKIGFGEQPFLVYKHLDAGHPHIHIVTTNIQKDGRRISLHNIGKNQSNTARKEIEITYNLEKTEQQEKKHSEKITPLNAQKVTYGKSATKRGISNVLDAVLTDYKYASLAESSDGLIMQLRKDRNFFLLILPWKHRLQ